jgi:hypothetical protein
MDKTPSKYLPKKDLHAKKSDFVKLEVTPEDFQLSEEEKVAKFETAVMCLDNPEAVIFPQNPLFHKTID